MLTNPLEDSRNRLPRSIVSTTRRLGAFAVASVLLFGQLALVGRNVRAEVPNPVARRTAQTRTHVPLPTPKTHYEKFGRGVRGFPLLVELLKESDPSMKQVLVKFAEAAGVQKEELAGVNTTEVKAHLQKVLAAAHEAGVTQESLVPKDEMLALVREINWEPYRPELLEFFLHESQVLDMIPKKWGAIWDPIIHDSMLYFLDHLSNDRLTEKVVDLAYLPPGTSRGDYLLTFVSKVPSLQKVGQIIARNPDLEPEYRAALQRLENGIRTMTRDEVVGLVTKDVGQETIDRYQVQFSEKLLAEASVGATIRATYVAPNTTERKEGLVKIVKPYVLVNLPEDLEILEGLALYFDKERAFYELGSVPLPAMFREIKNALAREIKIKEERQNFINAREYYKKNPKVLIPEIIQPLSTDQSTFMEFIRGEKITSSFPDQPTERAVLAKRMVDVLTFDVIFAKKKIAIFHGDPHAGNVFHVLGDKDPYRIALLDWGLYGTFPREERLALMQLLLGVELKDTRRLKKYAGYLIEGGMPTDPAKVQRIDAVIADVATPKEGRNAFDALSDLLEGLIAEGYSTKFSLTLFIKSQITVAGIIPELDPTLDQDAYLVKRVTGLVKSEIPMRLVNTVFFWNWDSHGYRSLLSNKDLMKARKIQSAPAKPAPAASPAAATPATVQ